MKKYTFKVSGMSCSHCERAVCEAVKQIAGVTDVSASAPKGRVVVQGDNVDTKAVAAAITDAGYESAGSEESDDEDGRSARHTAAGSLLIALCAAAGAAIFHFSASLGSIPVIPAEAGYGILFAAGMLTSFHCVAMCGGITLSVCAGGSSAEPSRKIMPSVLYNAGRIISYTIIGAAVGAAGSVFDFAPQIKSGIMIVAGLFMAVMGLRMLGFLSFIRLPSLPFLPKGLSAKTASYGPLAAGLLNGLMPCGPLQTMQLFAFGTGNAAAGAASMFFFSLGTAPLMFTLGAAGTFMHRRFKMTLYKAGGILVIVLGLVTVSSGLALSGKTIPAKGNGAAVSVPEGTMQKVTSAVTSRAYQPIVVQKGVPVTWTLKVPASQLNGCNNAIVIPALGIEKKLTPGDNTITFTPSKSGTIGFSCWMGMISSSITVVDNVTSGAAGALSAAPASTKSFFRGGSCCGRSSQQ